MSTWHGESPFFHFVATKSDNQTTLKLLATKGDDEVVSSRLATSTKYGTHTVLPSYLGVL